MSLIKPLLLFLFAATADAVDMSDYFRFNLNGYGYDWVQFFITFSLRDIEYALPAPEENGDSWTHLTPGAPLSPQYPILSA